MHARLLLATVCVLGGACHTIPSGRPAREDTDAGLRTPIADAYRHRVRVIVEGALASDGAWKKLSHLTDRIGNRLSGSPALEAAVTWASNTLEAEGHENVHTEKVMVPHWVRGAESGEIVTPVRRKLHLLALGGSAGTPSGGLTGELVVVTSFDELTALGSKVAGKIVVYNVPMPSVGSQGTQYGDTVEYRNHGPARAATLGATAALVRSVTARSLRSPHTGMTDWDDGPQIPAAAISTEDADLIARLVAKGNQVSVHIELGAHTLPDAESANVIGEITGSERPEEIVLIGAHLDSWDVGQGAHDDGSGCVIVMEALTVLRRAGLRPRRTIRVVLFTNEENGLAGAQAYKKAHAAELANHVAAIESDSGGFAPRGFSIEVDKPEVSERVVAQVSDIATLVAEQGATVVATGFSGADVETALQEAGVPLLGHDVDDSKYFDYHHSDADTLDKVDPRELQKNVAVMAVAAYVLADLPDRVGAETSGTVRPRRVGK